MGNLVFVVSWLVATLAAPRDVSGKVVVTTASELADAIRSQESVISIESRITGTFNEQLEQNSGVYALERYLDFPEVPERCLRAPGPCLADPTLLHLAVPTTFTSSNGALWDLGFLRRRLIVSQNVTIDSMRLRGLAADVQPYIFFFLFTQRASLTCVDCVLEHSCGGGDASFFLDSMRLASLSQQNVVASADGMSATGSVVLRAAQDVTAGTLSTQEFVNGTFRCDHSILRGTVVDTTVRPEEACQQASDDGHSYRGTLNTTRSGYTCQRWDSTKPNFHSRIPSAFPTAGLVDNYCRNPDNEAGVWCYTVDGPRWEHCAVPLCAEVAGAAVEQVDVGAASGGKSGQSEPAAAVGLPGGRKDARTAALAGVLAAVVALLAAVVAVALFLHRRRRRWSREHLALDSSSAAAKRILYGGSHSSRTDDDASSGHDKGTPAKAAVPQDPPLGAAGAAEPPASPEVTATKAAGGGGSGGGSGGSAPSHHSGRSARPAPAEELREALAEMEVDASQLVLHELVGRGGFGTVYRGTWRGLNVAVKTVTFQERSCGGGAQARAIAEAAITFSLSHRNVIATYFHEIKPLHFAPPTAAAAAVGAAVLADERLQDWKLFLVQEFCEGGSLRHLVDHRGFVNQHGRVKLRKCVECLVDIARGMEYIQDKQVIHGDLTPCNVLIRPQATPTPAASCQSSSPSDAPPASAAASAALPLPAPPAFSHGSAAGAPRAWHMLSDAARPGSAASPPADAAATPAGSTEHAGAAAAVPCALGSSYASEPRWRSPSAEPPRTPCREQPLPQPLPPDIASTSHFYSAMESMHEPDTPASSRASPHSSNSVRATGTPMHEANALRRGSGAEASCNSAGGAREQPRTEEFTVHIDAAPAEAGAACAADRRGGGNTATQDPKLLALTLHQPARAYQASPDSRGGAGAVRSPATWAAEPWRAAAVVSDFGLSMKLDPAAGHISNMRQGTPFYAAPEVRDAGFLSKAADSFSFGVIMWECFHCTPPYHVNRGGRIVRHPSFPDFPKDCPLSFAVLAVSCLAEDPADRPDFTQICGVLTDLAAHLRGEGDRATQSAHLTLTEVATHTSSPDGPAAIAASDDLGSAISGLLARAAGRPVASHSSSAMASLGSCWPLAGHNTPALQSMESMQAVIRSVTAGRAADRAHLLAAPRVPPAPGSSAGSSLSGSRPRIAARAHAFHSGSALPSHPSTGSAAPGSTASWPTPHSCQETIPEEDAEHQSGTMDSMPGQTLQL